MPQEFIERPRYANCFRIGYSEFEMIINFSQCVDAEDAPPHTRIILMPVYAKQLAYLLEQSLEEYQQKFGPLSRLT